MTIRKLPETETEALEWLKAEHAIARFEGVGRVLVSTRWEGRQDQPDWFTTEGFTLLDAIQKQYDYNLAELLDPFPVGLCDA
jgi:hypothetical protein